MLENGDRANFVFAFLRPHVTSMFVLKTQSQPPTANPRIIITNQMALNVVMLYLFAERLQHKPLVNSLCVGCSLKQQSAEFFEEMQTTNFQARSRRIFRFSTQRMAFLFRNSTEDRRLS